jgi:hypothetical protein
MQFAVSLHLPAIGPCLADQLDLACIFKR